MSFDLMAKAMKVKLGNPIKKLIFLKLCDNASDQGECWPSYQHIADQCEVSKRCVMTHIKELCDLGFLAKETRKTSYGNSSNLYKINFKSSESNSLGGELGSLGGSELGSPRTNHSLEPINNSIVDPTESTPPAELVAKGFDHVWSAWKEAKKAIGKKDTSPKRDTYEKKWKNLFNKAYFTKNTEQDFRNEVNQIAQLIKEAHAIKGFNRFENMQLPKFLNEKQWRDNNE